jgi:SAM-dependent methyltransferase
MNDTTAAKLLQLNAEFYQTFAGDFSDTRQRLQPGVRQILEMIDKDVNILDLGCGNGELARELAQRNFHGAYLGLDFSAELLDVARQGMDDRKNFNFVQANLGDLGWVSPVKNHLSQAAGQTFSVSGQEEGFDLVLAFAVLHHIPGRELHLRVLRSVRDMLASNGRFIHSNWQFLNSVRLRERIHPWSEIGITESDIDPGDYLLDWRRGGFGLRYVHHFNEKELLSLAKESEFRVGETFYSDGETGDLGLYQIWEIIG